MNYVVVQYFQK